MNITEEQAKKDNNIENKIQSFFKRYALSGLGRAAAMHWIKKAFEGNDEDLARIRPYLLLLLNDKPSVIPISPWQKGCPEIIPKLRALATWDISLFNFTKKLEESFKDIKEELLSLKGLENVDGKRGFQPYRAPSWASKRQAKDGVGSISHDAGNWNVYYLYLHNVDFQENRDRCPKTVALLDSIDNLYGHCFFSTLAPKTHITKHHGPTNKKLRVHLPLIVPNDDDDGTNKDGDTDTTTKSNKKSCRLRVGDDIINVTEGKCYIFDDSLEHEAWNDHSNQARIVLIFDIWHPDLTKKEIKFLSFLRKAEMKLEKKLCELAAANDHNLTKDDGDSNNNNKSSIEEENKANENFFQILEKARDLKIEPADLWGVYDSAK
jgi:aspartate beta-hydroxylase